MPRPGPRREAITVKLKPEAMLLVKQLAQRETEGNVSEMVRILMAEAVATRQVRTR